MKTPVVLAVSSYFKGNRFVETAHRLGAHVVLLTIEKCLTDPWAREFIDEVNLQKLLSAPVTETTAKSRFAQMRAAINSP